LWKKMGKSKIKAVVKNRTKKERCLKMFTGQQLLIASYTVKNVLDPLKDDFAKYLYDEYKDISISTPKDALLGQPNSGNFNIIIGEPPVLVSRLKSLNFELRIFSNKLDLVKQHLETKDFDLKELFEILDKIIKKFNLDIVRIGCAWGFNKKIEKNIITKLYTNFCNEQEKGLIGFTHETIKRFDNFYNLFVGTKVSEKNDANDVVMVHSTLVDANTIPSKETLNNEKDKHCEKIREYLMKGWQHINTLLEY